LFEKFDDLVSDINGWSILGTVREISKFHRSRGSKDYKELLLLLKDKLLRSGFDESEVKMIPYTIDGKESYAAWTPPFAWDLRFGELKLLPEKKLITSTEIAKTAVVFGSWPTNGKVKLEVVDVGSGAKEEDYKGKDVRGKAVLSSGNIRDVYRLAVKKKGAKAILSSFMRAQDKTIGRTPKDLPDAVNYLSIPCYMRDKKYKAFGFSLSYMQHLAVKKELQKRKKLFIETMVDTVVKKGKMYVLEITLKGTSPQMKSLIVLGHICHPSPGANDNASGAASTFELARTMKELIILNKMKPLRRTVKFLLVPEMFGTVPYLLGDKKILAAVNLDMVGENQKLTGSVLTLNTTPWSVPTFLNDLLDAAIIHYSPRTSDHFNGSYRSRLYEIAGFSVGSDHYIFNAFGIPSVSLTQWPDRYYHTNMDTLDKVDPASLEWASKAALASILYINLSDDKILELVVAKSLKRLYERIVKIKSFTLKNPEKTANFVLERELKTVNSLKAFLPVRRIKTSINILKTLFDSLGMSKSKRRNSGEIYKKTYRGPIGSKLNTMLSEESQKLLSKFKEKDGEWGIKAAELENLMDGRLTLDEIKDILDLEFSPTDENMIFKYVNILEKHGFLKKMKQEKSI